MGKRERVYSALEGQSVDKVPLSLWRHFYKHDQTPDGLAQATLDFYRKYGFDLINLTPNDFYAIEDWGAKVIPSKQENVPPQLKKTVIRKPEDWRNLSTLNPEEGSYGQSLEAIRLVRNQLNKNDAPVLMTVFSPMTLAYKMAEDLLLEHLQEHPTDVHIGLATIAETTSRFAEMALDAGADGIFFASHLSRADLLTPKMYQNFVVAYDIISLDRVKRQPAPLVLHLHGENPYFETVNQYPVHAISWHTHETESSLSKAQKLTQKPLMMGLDKKILEQSTAEEITHHLRETIQQTNGYNLILAPTCTISGATPPENLRAVASVDRSP